uniref:(northern house mosquito) hypothetical protein n=1 Tax=Culex pipiens TaxID=7175 RepID=A0A8D8AR90_CULPI
MSLGQKTPRHVLLCCDLCVLLCTRLKLSLSAPLPPLMLSTHIDKHFYLYTHRTQRERESQTHTPAPPLIVENSTFLPLDFPRGTEGGGEKETLSRDRLYIYIKNARDATNKNKSKRLKTITENKI